MRRRGLHPESDHREVRVVVDSVLLQWHVPMRMIIQEIMIDSYDPAELAKFWASLVNCRRGVINDALAFVAADPVRLSFQRVPEPKRVKNRLHLDIR